MPLKLSIEYDHTSGLYQATLENGARFQFRREDVGGKLENNLDLYRRAVISLIEDKVLHHVGDKAKERRDLMLLSAGKSPTVIAVRKNIASRRPINLDDLEI